MFKDVLNHSNLTYWAEAGLVVFFAVFVLTAIWAMTRPKKLVREWAAIPLASDQAGKDLSGGRDE